MRRPRGRGRRRGFGGIRNDQNLRTSDFCDVRIAAAIAKIHEWEPQRIVLSHDRCFDADADKVVRRIFGALPANDERRS